jgi:hypothetical protein
MAAGFAAALVAIAVIGTRAGAGEAAVAVLAAAAGACAPPLGVVMRSVWSALAGDRGLLQAAYSLDGVAEELLYVAGPVIAGVITVTAQPAMHDPAAVAWAEAAMSAGSALGGLGYGAVSWRNSARHRLVLLAAGLAVVLLPAALSPGLLVLALLAGVAGVLVSPALATAYFLADSLAPLQARNRAGNWVNSGFNAGSSAGSVLAGQLIGRVPLSACLPVLAAPALLAVLPLLRLRFAAAGQGPASAGGFAGGAMTPLAEAGDR